MIEEDEGGIYVEDRKLAINELLRSETWVDIVRPALRESLRDVRDKLERDRHLDISQVRELQGRAMILRALVDDPKSLIG